MAEDLLRGAVEVTHPELLPQQHDRSSERAAARSSGASESQRRISPAKNGDLSVAPGSLCGGTSSPFVQNARSVPLFMSTHDTIRFLLRSAVRLRAIAHDPREPNEAMKRELRQIAEECETEAFRLGELHGIDVGHLDLRF
jgi:hypothetical protein